MSSNIPDGATCASCAVEIIHDGEYFCSHTFHKKCIRRMGLTSRKSCPICSNSVDEIKRGDRSENFTRFIESFIKPAMHEKAWDDYWETNKAIHMAKFDAAFTCEDVDVTSPKNYQPYEKCGDPIITCYLVLEFFKRNPQTFNKSGVELNARNQICLSAGTHHAKMASCNNFEPYITARYGRWNNECERIQILEDVFEAFIGACVIVADDFLNGSIIGFSMCIVMRVLHELYKNVEMTISHTRMVDSKNRLKNLLEKNKTKMPVVDNKFHNDVVVVQGVGGEPEKLTVSTVYDKNMNVIGTGRANKKKDAERIAAESAIEYLVTHRQYIEYVPAIYKTYC